MFEGIDQQQMATLFAEFMAERMGQATPKTPYRDLWVKYEAFGTSRTDGGRMRIKSWNTAQRGHARRLLEFFGDLPWDQVNLGKAEEYRIYRRGFIVAKTGKPPVAGTINRELRSAQACLSFAVRRNLIARNPLAGMQDEKHHHDRGFAITEPEFLAICEHARPLLRWYLLVMWETGMRANELRLLEWSDINFETGIITLPAHKTKGGYERFPGMTELTRFCLEAIHPDGVNTYVFCNPGGRSRDPVSTATIKKWWAEARDAAGVKGPKGQPVWLHTLRHSWATEGVTRAGCDVKTIMAMAGWKDPKVADRYFNIAERHRVAATEKLNDRSTSILKALQDGHQLPAKRMTLHVVPKAKKSDDNK